MEYRMEFNETAWRERLKQAKTGEEIRAAVMAIPDDYVHPDSLLASSMAQKTTSPASTSTTPTEKTPDGEPSEI
jgi:hypothetical protein